MDTQIEFFDDKGMIANVTRTLDTGTWWVAGLVEKLPTGALAVFVCVFVCVYIYIDVFAVCMYTCVYLCT